MRRNVGKVGAVFALSALFPKKKIHITNVENTVETVENFMNKGLRLVATCYENRGLG